ncbi:hypothetical protein JYU20_00005, partial [Bacteroidales bacterium AH-315-I05]|nr:hypothetical protein [Bacteroidales bacterium AH-315-I05]
MDNFKSGSYLVFINYSFIILMLWLLNPVAKTYAMGAPCSGAGTPTGGPPNTLYQYFCGSNNLNEFNGNATPLTEDCYGVGQPSLSGFLTTYDFTTESSGACGVQDIYHFDENCGVKFDDGGNSNFLGCDYTIEMYLRLENLSSWKRLIDWSNNTCDEGMYTLDGFFNFWNETVASAAPFTVNQWAYAVFTRDCVTDSFSLYLNGAFVLTFADISDQATVKTVGADAFINFFLDTECCFPDEASAGDIAYLGIANYVMDSTEVALRQSFMPCPCQNITPQPTCAITDSTNISCSGVCDGTATVTASPGAPPYTYLWDDGSAQTDSIATGLCAATYTVKVTDINGDTVLCSVTLTEPTILTAAITDNTNVSCNGGSNGTAVVTPSGGTTPYTYLWSNGQTDSTATGLAAAAYTVTVTDNNSCTTTASTTITQPATALSVSMSNSTDVLCNGNSTGDATVTPAGGTSPYSYSWNNGQTDSTATGLAAGSYSVTATDINGCTATASITINEPTALSLSITNTTNASCGSSNGSATVTPSGSTSPYTYLWNNGQTDSTATGLSAASYTVIVTDANTCTDSISINISNIGGPTASITDTTHNVCNGDTAGIAIVTPSGGATPYTYLWNDGSAQTDSTATGLPAGTFTVTVTDNGTCVTLASVTITEPSALTIVFTASTQVDCNGNPTGSATITPSGGTSPYAYSWTGGQTDSTATGLAAGNYTISVTDNNGCIDSASITISEPTPLTMSITNTTNITCNGDSSGLAIATPSGGTSPYSYLWNNGQTDSTATGLSATSYTITATDNNGCSVSTSITITEPSAIVLTTTADSNASCNGYGDGGATLTLSGGISTYNYYWSTGDTTTATAATSNSVTGLLAGTYYITATDNNACTKTDSVTITEPLDVTLTMTQDSSVSCNGGSDGAASVSVVAGLTPYNYVWSTGDSLMATTDTSNSISGLLANTYYVTVSDANGCAKTDSIAVTEPTALNLATTLDNNASCNGGSDGGATVATAGGGAISHNFIWSSGDSTMNSASNLNSVTGLSAGTYFVTVTNAN